MNPLTEQAEVLKVPSGRTRVVDIGRGEPVVVLHGWGGRIESMAPTIDCLAGAFRVVAIDLPGFGESPAPREVWGTSDYAAFVREALGERGISRAHFVGHSFGAKTSLYLAATDGDLIDKLVLVGSSGLRTPPSLRVRARRAVSRAARGAGRIGGPGRALKNAVYRRIASQDYREAGPLRPTLVRVVNEDFEPLLRRVTSPTLLVWGSEDRAAPLIHARVMERLIPNAGLVVFERCGHFCYLEEPVRFCRVVRHFLGAPLP